jgi:hypothetical protein
MAATIGTAAGLRQSPRSRIPHDKRQVTPASGSVSLHVSGERDSMSPSPVVAIDADAGM